MVALASEAQGRVEDYLNDKFQNVVDLGNIDNLLAKIHEQQNLLREQLEQSRRHEHSCGQEYDREKAELKERAVKHQKDQADLTRRIQILTQSEVSDDAIAQLQVPMQKLRNIEVAEQYVNTLVQSAQLEKHAIDRLGAHPQLAVQAYQKLRSLLRNIQAARPATDDAADHLWNELSTTTARLHDSIKHHLEGQLRQTLDKMNWPKKDLVLSQHVVAAWNTHVDLLLQLQEPALLPVDADILSQTPTEPVILLPLALMVQPIAQRFKFNFYGDRPTNRLDKPEYFFNYILDMLEQHSLLMTDLLQPLLDERTRQDDRLDLIYTDALSSFITALLPMVTAKCLSLLSQITSQPQLMSHFVHEIMAFDAALQQSWAYAPFATPLSDFQGLTWLILTKHSYFDPWLKLEKDFALQRYEKIKENPDSRVIDYDGVEEGRTKPTKGAIRINDLLEKITERYRALASFSQKMKFLMDVQLSIFDRYHGYLFEALRDFQMNSHTAGRALTGAVSANEALGLPGLETLAKIYGSAEYLERKMTDWSDDVFFLELWEELQDRASRSLGVNGTLGRGLSVAEVAAKTSSTIQNADEILESDGGALFDETATAFRQLREASEAEIVRLLQINARNSLRPFQSISIWASLSSAAVDISQLPPSSALDSFNQTMTPFLHFLAKTVAAGSLRRIIKHLCSTIQEELYVSLVMKHTFSAGGANQLRRDVAAISSTIDSCLRLPGETARHLRRLNDALTLLSLPIKPSKSSNVAEMNDEDGWGFEEEDVTGVDDLNDEFDQSSWGLWQAEKAIFADNMSARKALESLGLTQLSEGDARSIIRRRIEVNG